MHHTFELFFRDDQDRTSFEVLTCPPHEVIHHARRLLKERGAKEVEVRKGGQHAFTLAG